VSMFLLLFGLICLCLYVYVLICILILLLLTMILKCNTHTIPTQLTDWDVNVLVTGIPSLEVLDLSYTLITDAALQYILQKASHLKQLYLVQCYLITGMYAP